MPHRSRRLSPASVAVLRALAGGVTYGFDVMDATGLRSGTVYPVLARMERRDLVQSKWEDPDASRRTGRPARKHYRITASGRRALAEAAAWYRELGTPRTEGA